MLNLHAVMPSSRANGPGHRAAIWFQGCSLRCPGCFNPLTHDPAPRILTPVEELAATLRAASGRIEGVTLTGGEPLQQPGPLLDLLQEIHSTTCLSVVLFSGYTLDEIQKLALGPAILSFVDVLIGGRFDASRRLTGGLRGSENQRIHILTDRYRMEDLERTPPAEVVIDKSGDIVASGVHPLSPRAFDHNVKKSALFKIL